MADIMNEEDSDISLDDVLMSCELSTRTAHLVSAGMELVSGVPAISATCVFCGTIVSVECRRLNTAYHDEASNWMTSCRCCWKSAVEHYKEMWLEYYSGQGI